MNKVEARELIQAMNRHMSIKEAHLEIIDQLSTMIVCLAKGMPQDIIAEESAHTLVSMQRIMELHNCEGMTQNAVETILERYREDAV